MSIARLSVLLRHIVIAWVAISVLPASAATQVLYDGALGTDNTYNPTTPGWLSGELVGLTQTVTPGEGTAVALSVPPVPFFSGNSALGGYSSNFSSGAVVNPAFPSLDRSVGFSLGLGFLVSQESHSGNLNRAGFSIILIGSDLKGVEIGFQNDRIFAQNDSTGGIFTAGESTTTPAVIGTSFNRWDLAIQSNGYALTRGGAAVLSGALRDYSSSGITAYTTPNYLFFGDDTQSAQAAFAINFASITTPIPEPSGFAMLLAGLVLVGAIAHRRRAAT